ncbi:MAG: leucyl aminopeptidase [Acidimicrobiaceae bacterium]|nr:leucyl aminopeptidase [Acidimicrobiaceae bacterium]
MNRVQVSVQPSIESSEVFEINLVGDDLQAVGGSLPNRELAKGAGFTGKTAQTLIAFSESSNKVSLFVGLGDNLDKESFRLCGAAAVRSLAKDVATAALLAKGVDADLVAAFAEGTVLGHYRYDALRGRGFDTSSLSQLSDLIVIADESPGLQSTVSRAVAVANATCLARDLINEPAATMTPTRFAEIASDISQANGISCRIWDKSQIEKEALGGLLAVARGSVQEPRMIKMSYRPGSDGGSSRVALVGKGITFDSGGLSLKGGEGMMTMKTDMSGAAAVLATMSVLTELGVNVAVDGYMALTENMPSGSATKPGDVFIARNGMSVEVLNTDAEGRLVLADALSLATEDGADEIIDLATLTGACVVALGREIAGVMGNDADLIKEVLDAGDAAGEPLWQLPLPARYKKHIESEVADMKNIGAPGAAGTLSAALLLKEFVGDTPWAHLDIAGPSRSDADDRYFRKGATGFGVRTLCKYLEMKSL